MLALNFVEDWQAKGCAWFACYLPDGASTTYKRECSRCKLLSHWEYLVRRDLLLYQILAHRGAEACSVCTEGAGEPRTAAVGGLVRRQQQRS